MAPGEWILHMNNASCHATKDTREFIDHKGIKMINHPPYSPDLAPQTSSSSPQSRGSSRGFVDARNITKEWKRACNIITKDSFAMVFKKWIDCCKKFIALKGGYMEQEK